MESEINLGCLTDSGRETPYTIGGFSQDTTTAPHRERRLGEVSSANDSLSAE